MNKLIPPITWYGGKIRLTKWLSQFIPPHKCYLEVFGGSGALLFYKEPAGLEVYNDIDGDLVNLFRVIRCRNTFEEFRRLVALTPYSREEYITARDSLCIGGDVERAHKFYIAVWMAFSSTIGRGWSYSVTMSRRGMAGAVSRWLSSIDRLEDIHNRMRTVQIENLPWDELLDKYIGTPDTFVYCDPPYYSDARTSQSEYRHEMGEEEHILLVNKLKEYPYACVLSGYSNELYGELESCGWKRFDKSTVAYSERRKGVGRTNKVESAWVNERALRGLRVTLF